MTSRRSHRRPSPADIDHDDGPDHPVGAVVISRCDILGPVTPLDALTGLVIALGLVGIVVMVLPGTVMILGALLVWEIGRASCRERVL